MNLRIQFNHQVLDYKQVPYMSYEQRRKSLIQIKKMLQTHASDLANAVSQDFTYRSHKEILLTELFLSVNAINYCLKHFKHWMKNRKRHVAWQFKPTRAYLRPQPLGVVGIMVPWNYPIYLSIVPIIYAIAAGNRVMVKMSELTPNTGLLLQSLLHNAGISDAHVTIVQGDIDVAKAFASLPFAHLLFTGSSEVGKQVMAAASKNLTPVTLELGGKSPAVISETVNKHYLNRLFMGKLFNAGQTCVAPDYLLVPNNFKNEVKKHCHDFLQSHYPELTTNNDYSSIISTQHKLRLLGLLDDAKQQGAEIIQLGEPVDGGSKLPLYLLFNVNSNMRVMQEEIFGPILPIIGYDSLDEAIELINQQSNPLVLYYFGESKEEIHKIEMTTLSGALVINQTGVQVALDDVPFGGVGGSGMGNYHGVEGFNTFSKLKPIVFSGRFSPVTWLYPPYGKLLDIFLTRVGGIKLKN